MLEVTNTSTKAQLGSSSAESEHELAEAIYSVQNWTDARWLAKKLWPSLQPATPVEAARAQQFAYQQTFDAIASAVSFYPDKHDPSGISISVRKFQEAFNNHRDAIKHKCKLCGLEDGACICAHIPTPDLAQPERNPDATEMRDLRQAVIELRDWKAAVLGCCKACDGFEAMQWGGDKEGWGFVMFFIGHLNTRALAAEKALAVTSTPSATPMTSQQRAQGE